jgi:hypothetical protein
MTQNLPVADAKKQTQKQQRRGSIFAAAPAAASGVAAAAPADNSGSSAAAGGGDKFAFEIRTEVGTPHPHFAVRPNFIHPPLHSSDCHFPRSIWPPSLIDYVLFLNRSSRRLLLCPPLISRPCGRGAAGAGGGAGAVLLRPDGLPGRLRGLGQSHPGPLLPRETRIWVNNIQVPSAQEGLEGWGRCDGPGETMGWGSRGEEDGSPDPGHLRPGP